MKIKLIITLFSALLVITCTENKAQSLTINKNGFYGNVRTVITKSYKAQLKDEKIVMGEAIVSGSNEVNFSPNGILVTSNPNNDIQYDQKGNILFQSFEDKNGLKVIEKNLYDDKSNLLKQTITNGNGIVLSSTENKVENGKIVESVVIKGEEPVTIKTLFKYETKGNVVITSIFDGKNNLVKKTTEYFDSNNNPTSTKIEEGASILNTTYVYNKLNNLIEKSSTDKNGLQKSKFIYDYDEKGNLVKSEMLDYNKKATKIWIYKYNDNNIEIEQKFINVDRNLTTEIISEIDAHGNWIKRIYYLNDNPTKIVERKIIYY